MTSVYIEKEWSSSKNLQIVKAGDGVEKRELSYTIGENVNWYNHYGEQCRGSIKKKKNTKNKDTIWFSNPTPEHVSREKHDAKGYTHPNVHWSIISNSQNVGAT